MICTISNTPLRKLFLPTLTTCTDSSSLTHVPRLFYLLQNSHTLSGSGPLNLASELGISTSRLLQYPRSSNLGEVSRMFMGIRLTEKIEPKKFHPDTRYDRCVDQCYIRFQTFEQEHFVFAITGSTIGLLGIDCRSKYARIFSLLHSFRIERVCVKRIENRSECQGNQ